MFDHVTIRCADRLAAETFYDTVLSAVGLPRAATGANFTEWGDFSVAQADQAHPPTRGVHIGFAAESLEQAEAFWLAGTAAGYPSDGPPGRRPVYGEDYYGAFLLDPDGNSIEAALHGDVRPEPGIDHVWLRVADVAASRRFYEDAGCTVVFDSPGRVRFRDGASSFSVVAGEPTEHLHMAFPAASNEDVDVWHARMLEAGHPDNGAPGERPIYHPGYYGAFVLDPDGNNIEVVCHNRTATITQTPRGQTP